MKAKLLQKKIIFLLLGACLLAVFLLLFFVREQPFQDPFPGSNSVLPEELEEREQQAFAKPVNHGSYKPLVYLLTLEDDYLMPITLALQAEKEGNELAGWLMEQLFGWPYPNLARSPVPEGMPMPEVTLSQERATLNFPALPPNLTISSVEESFFIKSLVLTLTEIPQIKEVSFLLEGKESEAIFGYTDTSAPLKRPSSINLAEEDLSAGTPVRVWFGDSQALFAVPLTFVSTVEGDYPTRFALEKLLEGPPAGSALTPVVPQGTTLKGLRVQEKLLEADFSRELIDNHMGGSTGEAQTLRCLVLTATEALQGLELQILIEGEIVDSLAGHFLISRPLPRETVNLLP
ncbi:MAG: hypothetical protein GX767_04615 [Firmicutes bacterium]|nr:hypothetical protein [Bacillota bacterium]